jgi:hypothetical protein
MQGEYQMLIRKVIECLCISVMPSLLSMEGSSSLNIRSRTSSTAPLTNQQLKFLNFLLQFKNILLRINALFDSLTPYEQKQLLDALHIVNSQLEYPCSTSLIEDSWNAKSLTQKIHLLSEQRINEIIRVIKPLIEDVEAIYESKLINK